MLIQESAFLQRAVANTSLIFGVGLVVFACTKHDSITQIKTQEVSNTSHWPKLSLAVEKDPNVEKRIDILLDKMSLEQKVGQMTQAEITWVTPEDVKRLHLGSVLNGGGTFLNGKRHADIDEWVAYMDAIYDASMDTSDGGLAIPVTYGIDAVHGNNKFGHATIFPHNIGLGAARNPELIKKIGEVTALEVLATGIDWTFAPTLAVVQDDRWGRTYESYSEEPSLIAVYGRAMVEGIQGVAGTTSFLGDNHVYATAKHWVGDGGTDNGVDQGNNTLSEKALAQLQASAYFPSIEGGVQSIMASHNFWQGEKLHGHKYLLTDVLKNKLGFDGFVVGDWNAHGNVKGCTNDSCPQSVNAGLDMFMVVEDYEAFINNTVRQVKDGLIPISRIDDAVRRILRVKIRSGLFEKGRPSSRPHAGDRSLMGSEAHRDVARQAVRESLVLLKNNNQLLPLNPNQHILVAGDGADSMAKQSGGWTISWQSTELTKDDFEGASTLLDGFKAHVNAAGGTIEYDLKGNFQQKPDVAIVVFGEAPYAEWFGDTETIAYKPYSSQDVDLLNSLQAKGIPVVSIFLSGRPLWVNREINGSDAFIAAWLPGSEGIAVADVIFADIDGRFQHDFKGKLSFSWPKRASQVSLNIDDENYDPLFPYGFGLTYSDNSQLAKLNEVNDFVIEQVNNEEFHLLSRGLATPWQMMYDYDGQPQFLASSREENSVLAIMEADYQAQGDAQEFYWSGEKAAHIGIGSGYHREDLTRFTQKGVIKFDVRAISDPTGSIALNLGCSEGYCGGVDVVPWLPDAASKSWRTIAVSMSCFTSTGVEFERSGMPFSLYSKTENRLRLTNIVYTNDFEGDVIACP